jgi:hypothetical protein
LIIGEVDEFTAADEVGKITAATDRIDLTPTATRKPCRSG